MPDTTWILPYASVFDTGARIMVIARWYRGVGGIHRFTMTIKMPIKWLNIP